MYKYISLLLLATLASSISAFDLKLINNSRNNMTFRLSSYKGLRDHVRDRSHTATGRGELLKLLVCPPVADLDTFLNEYSSHNYDITVVPNASLVIEDVLPQESLEVGGALFWRNISLSDAQTLVKEAKPKKEEGLLTYLRRMPIITVTPTTTGYNTETSYREVSTRKEKCHTIEEAYKETKDDAFIRTEKTKE